MGLQDVRDIRVSGEAHSRLHEENEGDMKAHLQDFEMIVMVTGMDSIAELGKLFMIIFFFDGHCEPALEVCCCASTNANNPLLARLHTAPISSSFRTSAGVICTPTTCCFCLSILRRSGQRIRLFCPGAGLALQRSSCSTSLQTGLRPDWA